jgi:hypothetical protein
MNTMKKLKWFAASIIAEKNLGNGEFTIQSSPLALQASSKEEALGKALEYSRTYAYPIKDNWYGHQAQVVEVPM